MPEIISARDAQYALDIVRAICSQVGPGLPGSPQERARAAVIQKELASHLGAENVCVEEFSLSPGAFLSPYPLSALFTIIAALLNISVGNLMGIAPLFPALAAAAFSILSLVLVIFEFSLGHELIDPLLRKKRSVNVIGKLRAPGTKSVKRLLILSGHHDSAWENTWIGFLGNVKRRFIPTSQGDGARENSWLLILGYLFYFASTVWFIGLFVMAAASLIQLAGILAGNAGVIHLGTLGWALLAFLIAPSIVFGLFFNRGRKNGGTVPGAVDNLAASALAAAMCRFLVNNPACVPPDTEIHFVSFGAEEAGLRGSRRYVERHLDELRRLDARLLNFEMVGCPEITILASDGNGSVKNSPEMVASVIAAAERAEIPYRVKPASFGTATDATPFSRAGIKAAALFPFQMPQQMVTVYHQKVDGPDALALEPLLNVLKLAFEWVRCGGDTPRYARTSGR